MVFGQLTHRESLSDTILCLKANANKLCHLGIGKAIAKSILSTINEKEIGEYLPTLNGFELMRPNNLRSRKRP